MDSSWALLPTTALGAGSLSAAFAARGCRNFRDAARLIQKLPYGRTSSPSDYLSVLEEERGTCSSKHALAALLAKEIGVDTQLTLACFEMNEANTPGVGTVLIRHGLTAILEAHCNLRFEIGTVDLTWPVPSNNGDITYLSETPIEPEHLASRKRRYHRQELASWGEKLSPTLSLDALWDIREQCIAGLQTRSSIALPALL